MSALFKYTLIKCRLKWNKLHSSFSISSGCIVSIFSSDKNDFLLNCYTAKNQLLWKGDLLSEGVECCDWGLMPGVST